MLGGLGQRCWGNLGKQLLHLESAGQRKKESHISSLKFQRNKFPSYPETGMFFKLVLFSSGMLLT